jgi:predicted ArsR family transcriptional regulator
MLEYLFTSKTKEQILIYLAGRNEGYAREIADYYNKSLSVVQSQLNRLENGSIIVSQKTGRTIIFKFNTRYTFYRELINLLLKAIDFLPEKEKERLLFLRKRPRRKGKPL